MQVKWTPLVSEVIVIGLIIAGISLDVRYGHRHAKMLPVKYTCSAQQYEAGECDPQTDAAGNYTSKPAVVIAAPKPVCHLAQFDAGKCAPLTDILPTPTCPDGRPVPSGYIQGRTGDECEPVARPKPVVKVAPKPVAKWNCAMVKRYAAGHSKEDIEQYGRGYGMNDAQMKAVEACL